MSSSAPGTAEHAQLWSAADACIHEAVKPQHRRGAHLLSSQAKEVHEVEDEGTGYGCGGGERLQCAEGRRTK